MKIVKKNLKEMMKNKKKGEKPFRSIGYTTVKKTFIDENGKQVTEGWQFEIRPLGSHPMLKEFIEHNPAPKPPVKRDFVNILTGESAVSLGLKPEKVKDNPNFDFANVYDFTNEKYQEEKKAYEKQIRILQIMIALEFEEEFGLEKIEEFEKELDEMGFTSNQLNQIGNDIHNLDAFTESEKKELHVL